MMDLQFMDQMATRYRLKPFWDKGVDLELKAERMREFYIWLYPIWYPIVSKAILSDRANGDFQDLGVIHACDQAIMNSNKSPDREAPKGKMDTNKARVIDKVNRAAGIKR